jgi:hypothetical protein
MEDQAIGAQEPKAKPSSLMGLQLFPMRLQFRAEVWQNRPNRIEIHGDGISDYFITNSTKLEKFPMHVVSKSPSLEAVYTPPVKMPVVTLPNGSKFTIYNMDLGNPTGTTSIPSLSRFGSLPKPRSGRGPFFCFSGHFWQLRAALILCAS